MWVWLKLRQSEVSQGFPQNYWKWGFLFLLSFDVIIPRMNMWPQSCQDVWGKLGWEWNQNITRRQRKGVSVLWYPLNPLDVATCCPVNCTSKLPSCLSQQVPISAQTHLRDFLSSKSWAFCYGPLLFSVTPRNYLRLKPPTRLWTGGWHKGVSTCPV